MKKMALIGLLLAIGLAFAVPNAAFAHQDGTPSQWGGWYCPMMQNAAQGSWYCPMMGGNSGAGYHRMGYGYTMRARSFNPASKQAERRSRTDKNSGSWSR